MTRKATNTIPNSLLRMARKERGWTQQQVADQIGAPLALNVTRWERGNSLPSAHYTERLCQLFGRSASELGLLRAETALEQHPTEESMAETRHYWYVPYRRNAFFTGREELLNTLHQTLHSANSAPSSSDKGPAITPSRVALTPSYALSGLGGTGKTQLALEYAYRFRDYYDAIFWVRAASQETLAAEFINLAHLLALPEHADHNQQTIVDAVLRWFASYQHPHDGHGWLLILDNADDLALLQHFLPQTGAGHILLTTRTRATGALTFTIAVEKMAEEEGMLFLLRRAKLLAPAESLEHVDRATLTYASTIVQQLDALPLALEQAGAYIEEMGCGLDDYLTLYQDYRKELLKRQSGLSQPYPYTVMSTWSLSFQKVEQANPAAAALLRLCAFLAPDAIAETMLTRGASRLGPLLEPVVADPLLFNEALGVLRAFSLMERHPQLKVLTIHRLVQVVLQEEMSEQIRRQWAERAVALVAASFPEVDVTTWADCEDLLPHAHICAELIREHHFVVPAAAQLLSRAGQYLRDRVRYEQAELFLQQALDICEELYDPYHPDTAAALDKLACLYVRCGRFAEAEPLYLRALTIYEHTSGTEQTSMISMLNSLAMLYWELARYDQVEHLLLRALQLQEQQAGKEDLQTATTLSNLAILYWAQGKYEKVEDLDLRALRIREQLLGLEHPDTAELFSNLGVLYQFHQRYAEAEALHLRALAIYEQIDDFNITFVFNNLASLYRDQGQFERAKSFLLRTLMLREQKLGMDHPDVASTLQTLAELYHDQGNLRQAEPLYQRVLAIRETSAPASPRIARTLYQLARLYHDQRQLELARPLYQRALAIQEQKLIAGHATTALTREHYHNLLQEIGHDEKAASPSSQL